jgi:plastocyanin
MPSAAPDERRKQMRGKYPGYVRFPARGAGRIITLLVLIFTVLVLVTACGGSSDTTTTASGTTGGGGVQVAMKSLAFDPESVTIKAGESVTWTNQDSASHTVVGDNGEFQSGDLAKGAGFTFTFDKAGTYTYHCSIHPSMKGTVVVQ